MSLKSRIVSAVSGEDADVSAAVEALRKAKQVREDIGHKHNVATAALIELRQQLGREALAAELGNDRDYRSTQAAIEKKEAEVERLTLAEQGAIQAEREAQHALDMLSHDKVMSGVKRKCNARVKYAKQMNEALEAFARAWVLFHENSEQLGAILPYGIDPEGMLLIQHEIVDASKLEMRRVHSVDPLDTHGVPSLPGANVDLLVDATRIPSLADLVEAANSYLIHEVDKRGNPDFVPPLAVDAGPLPTVDAASVSVEHVSLNDITEQPTGPTVSVAEAQAMSGLSVDCRSFGRDHEFRSPCAPFLCVARARTAGPSPGWGRL